MKNFYELLDIKEKIFVSLTVAPIIDTLPPCMSLQINDITLHHGSLTEKKCIQHCIKLLDDIDIKITLYNKDYKKFNKIAILIESCNIDDFEIVPKWTQLANYKNDNSFTEPTNYLGFNGVWNLKITEPFYRWKHRITGQGWLLEP